MAAGVVRLVIFGVRRLDCLFTCCLELPRPIWRFDAQSLECPTHCIAAQRIPSAVLLLGAAVSELIVLSPEGWSVYLPTAWSCHVRFGVLMPGGLSVRLTLLLPRLPYPVTNLAARRIPPVGLLLEAAVSYLLTAARRLPCLTCFLLSRGCYLSIFLCGAVVSYLLVLPPQDWSILTCRLLIESCRVSLPAAVLTGSCSSFHLPYADWRLPSLSTCRLLTRGCSSFHLPTSWRLLEASIDLPAASPCMRGGGCSTCDIEDRRTLSTYLPPCRGCEAAVEQPATWMAEGRSRLTRRLVVDARRLSHCLRPRCPEPEVNLPADLELI